jgi:hypothetical protein
MNLKEALIKAKAKRGELDDAKKVVARLQKEHDDLTINVIPEIMAEEDISTATIEGVGRVSLRDDMRCNVLSANTEALQAWLASNGHESLIKTTINASTLKAFIKEQIREGNDYPEDLVNVHPYTRAVITK